jgi:hypothetical protein
MAARSGRALARRRVEEGEMASLVESYEENVEAA